MLWLLRRVMNQVLKILLSFFILATVTVDDLAAQQIFHKAKPTLIQALNNDDLDDSKCNAWKTPNYAPRKDNDAYLRYFVIKTYLAQDAEYLIPFTPAIFFQPDRAPPLSSL
jgi:hypothetical protein